ncbi:hypothetical protein HED22_15790 [Thalassospira sp. HF15]|uniref:hypothetical protein n=1 Tax=Thalassospira sp. HF15 TaxID=2722755 RepID=UPI0014311A53|nr:hypothetical protein [Thalassospira sp. HF15]NIY77115.1 hypothetical protein [Thalassospira sp. HF15]
MKFDTFCIFAEAIDQLKDGRMVIHGGHTHMMLEGIDSNITKLVIGLWVRLFEKPSADSKVEIEIHAPGESVYVDELEINAPDELQEVVSEQRPLIAFRTFTRTEYFPAEEGDFAVFVSIDGEKKFSGAMYVGISTLEQDQREEITED